MATSGFVTVSFHVVEPDPGSTTWTAPFPKAEVFDAVKSLDFASGKYYMPSRLLGNEVFCQVVDDGPLTLVVGYTRDTWSDRLSERKGEVRRHELEADAAWVDPAYTALFPNDVMGIVRSSLNSPGSATIAHWLSQYGPHSFYLKGLQKADVFADLKRPADEIYGLHLRIHRSLIGLIRGSRPDVASAFEQAGKVGAGSSTLSLGLQAGVRAERAAWWPPMKAVINDLAEANLLVDFEAARVKVSGGPPVNLKDAYLTARVPISRYAKKKFSAAEAADALATAYHSSEAAVLAAVEAWRAKTHNDRRGRQSGDPPPGEDLDEPTGD